jgi:hypothetical protein
VTRTPLALTLLALLIAAPAHAQSVTAETDVSVGRSTEAINAAGVQVRLFGPVKRSDWRIYVEAAFGAVTTSDSDAFGAAYPYDRRLRPMEMYVERMFRPAGVLVGVKGGRYRTPFGISGRGDHAYNGFTRAPLVRYGDNWSLSNTFLETGVDLLVGTPRFQVETSLGVPTDEGEYQRRRGLTTVTRAQGYYRALIVGASYLRTERSEPEAWATGRMVFRGIDGRFAHRGLQLRGEWIDGRPFDGVTTRGGYLDVIFDRRWMGPVTAIARFERLDYEAGEHSAYLRRQTAGARVRLSQMLSLQLNVIRQPGGLTGGRRIAFDTGLTFSFRF